ncbi:MAG: trypsin-like peptidase domain-containing protein [Lachnospiraceae bacterium]|nr:trypsin-like peptidase domain-containing protein [Lachnospiraceae bacterium]
MMVKNICCIGRVVGIYIMVIVLCFFLKYKTNAAGVAVEESGIPKSVADMQSGVLKIAVYLEDQNGAKYYVKQGTALLIGNAGEGQYIITSDELIKINQNLKNNVLRQNGLDAEANLTVMVDIILPMGTSVAVNVSDAKQGEDFAVLELNNSLYGVECLKVGESSKVKQNDKLYMLAYQGEEDIFAQDSVIFSDAAQVTSIVSETDSNSITVDYVPENGNIGGAFFNSEGYVVGILLKNEGVFYVKPIDKVKDVLNLFGVSYTGIDDSSHYNEVTEEIAHQLNELLLECEEKAVQSDTYSKKSLAKLKTSILSAIKVVSESQSTYDDYVACIEDLEKNKNKLKNKDYGIKVFQGILLLFILLISFLNILTMRKIKRLRCENGGVAHNGINTVIYAKLIRLDTMQEIPISNVIFRIGKSAEGIDYVIKNNTSISSRHADIMRKGNEFFILDNNSTNHTYVNGKQAMPGDFVKIEGGDRIRLSDVEFLFEV